MVAYRLHFEEATLKAMQLVESGAIGNPRVFASVFGHVVRPGDIRERPEMGGGAMFDLGVYCVNAARNLFRSEPVLAFAVGSPLRWRKRVTGSTKRPRHSCSFPINGSRILRSAI
jgi:predicted dehydrogenase